MIDIDVQRIKDQHDIVNVVGLYVDLKKKGKDHFGCCPFHGEKTPSFSVNQNKQFYHCFGCGAQGDVIKFLMDIKNIEFMDALGELGHSAALTPDKSIKTRIQNQSRRVALPFDKEPFSKEELTKVFNRCEVFGDIFVYKQAQVTMLTDIDRNPVTVAFIHGAHKKPDFFRGEFLHGSCAIFGEQKGAVHLCENWFTAKRLSSVQGLNAICYFEPTNLFYIADGVKRKGGSVIVVADSQESVIQADKLNLLNCYLSDLTNKVNLDLEI